MEKAKFASRAMERFVAQFTAMHNGLQFIDIGNKDGIGNCEVARAPIKQCDYLNKGSNATVLVPEKGLGWHYNLMITYQVYDEETHLLDNDKSL
jgi:hypothetical protein